MLSFFFKSSKHNKAANYRTLPLERIENHKTYFSLIVSFLQTTNVDTTPVRLPSTNNQPSLGLIRLGRQMHSAYYFCLRPNTTEKLLTNSAPEFGISLCTKQQTHVAPHKCTIFTKKETEDIFTSKTLLTTL